MALLENIYFRQGIVLVVQLILSFIILKKLKKSTKDFSFLTFKKIIPPLVYGIAITSGLQLYGISLLFGIVLLYYTISNVLAYPQDFRNFLDDYHERKVSKKNVSRLISDENIEALAETIVRSYRQKLSTVFVITREDALTEIENSGYKMGRTEINSDLLELLFKPNSALGKGAVVIRDNYIVANNCKLPMFLENEQLKRAGTGNKHLGMLSVISSTDAVVIGTSGDSGYITMGGTRPDGSAYFRILAKMQEHDLQNGLSKGEIIKTIKVLLEGVGNPEDYAREKELEQEKQRKLEEASRKKLERAKNVKSKEQKIAERNEKRRKNREE